MKDRLKSTGLQGVQELKIYYGPGYRVYFGQEVQQVVILLCGEIRTAKMKISEKHSGIGRTIKRKKITPTIDYNQHLFQDLKDVEYAAGYLTAAIEEGEDVFLLAVRDVVQAQTGMTNLARSTKLNRENLYGMLSMGGNPRLSSIISVLNNLGLGIKFLPKLHGKNAA